MAEPSLTKLNPKIPKDNLKLPPKHEPFFNVCYEDDPPFALLDAESKLLSLPVRSAKMLSSGEDVKEIIELEFDQNVPNKTGQIKIETYEPGWTIGIIPQNDPDEVQELMEQLDIADQSYILHVREPVRVPKDMSHIPFHSTVRSVFLNVLDIRRIPSKNFLRLLSTCTTNNEHKLRLEQLSSHQGKTDYRQFIEKRHLSILDLMKAFPTCKPGFASILENLPRLQPRIYTISSSPLSYEPEHSGFTITFSVTPDKKNGRYGVCSGYLNRIAKQLIRQQENSEIETIRNKRPLKVSLYFRTPTSCSLPNDRNLSIVMIAPGLGIVPFIGFLRHRYEEKIKNKLQGGRMLLFLGCRYPDRDHIYKEELDKYLAEGILEKCYKAFSRVEPFEIKYVQHQINKKHTGFASMLQRKKFIVYYCGELRWSRKTVYKSFLKCLQEMNYSEEQAVEEIDCMTRTYKIVWTDWPK